VGLVIQDGAEDDSAVGNVLSGGVAAAGAACCVGPPPGSPSRRGRGRRRSRVDVAVATAAASPGDDRRLRSRALLRPGNALARLAAKATTITSPKGVWQRVLLLSLSGVSSVAGETPDWA